jgi:hypothetical protein
MWSNLAEDVADEFSEAQARASARALGRDFGAIERGTYVRSLGPPAPRRTVAEAVSRWRRNEAFKAWRRRKAALVREAVRLSSGPCRQCGRPLPVGVPGKRPVKFCGPACVRAHSYPGTRLHQGKRNWRAG